MAAAALREDCEKDTKGVRARRSGQFHRHAALRARDDGTALSRLIPRGGVRDPLVRARLQGSLRLRLGVGCHRLGVMLGADTPQRFVRPDDLESFFSQCVGEPTCVAFGADPGRRDEVSACRHHGSPVEVRDIVNQPEETPGSRGM